MRAQAPVTIGIALGNEVVREGVAGVLRANGILVRVCVGDARALVRAAREEHFDVCLVDGTATADLIETVAELADGRTAVVVLTAEEDELELLRVVEVGACGLLAHDADAAHLPAVVRGVAAGEAAVSRRLVRRLLDRLHDERRTVALTTPDGRRVELSPRETTILEQVGAGVSTVGAAEQLGISPVTARRHISSAVRKLGVADRAAAVAALQSHQLHRSR